MKRIIFFSKNLNIGGMEKALVTLLNNLVDEYEVTLVLEDNSGILKNDLNTKIILKEFKLSKCKIVILRKLKNFLKRICWYLKNHNKYDFSCNYATYSIIGTRLAQISSLNCSLYVHSNYYESFDHNIINFKSFFKNHNIYKFKNIIFVSNESMLDFLKVYPDLKNKCNIINNLIDYNNILKMSKCDCIFDVNKNDNNFLFIGRLDNESKNLALLIDSFIDIVKIDSKYKLFLIGDGTYKNVIKQKIRNCPNILLLGEIKNPYPYLVKCDSLILTSNYEGFPVVYLEALVLNKQIYTTVIVSDESIKIGEYAVKLEYDKDKIIEKLLCFEKKSLNYNLDFQKINNKKINKIRDIIEV